MRNAECGMRNGRSDVDSAFRIPHSAFAVAHDRPPALRWRRRLVHGSVQTREPARRDPTTHSPRRGRAATGGAAVLVYYSSQPDLGDGCEDPDVHHDTPELHEAALRMGVNLFAYAVSSTR